METVKQRIRRSEKLTKEELQAYRKYVDGFDTKVDAAAEMGFSTVTLNAVYLKGSGKPVTLAIIREKLNLATAA